MSMGYQICNTTPEKVAQKIKVDIEKWTKVIKAVISNQINFLGVEFL